HGQLELVLLEVVGMARQQVVEHAELERQEFGTEEFGVELEQALKHRPGLALARCACRRGLALVRRLLCCLWKCVCHGFGLGEKKGWASARPEHLEQIVRGNGEVVGRAASAQDGLGGRCVVNAIDEQVASDVNADYL